MHTLAARMGFALRHNVIEAHGLCAGCVEVEACSTRDTASTIILFSSKESPLSGCRSGKRVNGASVRHSDRH